jgi:lipopolysaccharide/colanic/teichoic acid biosynthesis glycosyltransferase
VSPAKRAFDLFWSTLGLAVLWPALLTIGVLIKLDDGGPALFRQVRVGRGGRTFRIVKFRTMTVDADRSGMLLTVGNDQRITRLGRWLRRFKLDELPQLFNVLWGQMTLVGPRPEVPRYVAHYALEQRDDVLSLTPGITHPGIIWNEDRLLARSSNPEHFYITELLPEKNRRYLAYAARASVWTDFLVILGTLRDLLLLPAAHSGSDGRMIAGDGARAQCATLVSRSAPGSAHPPRRSPPRRAEYTEEPGVPQ